MKNKHHNNRNQQIRKWKRNPFHKTAQYFDQNYDGRIPIFAKKYQVLNEPLGVALIRIANEVFEEVTGVKY